MLELEIYCSAPRGGRGGFVPYAVPKRAFPAGKAVAPLPRGPAAARDGSATPPPPISSPRSSTSSEETLRGDLSPDPAASPLPPAPKIAAAQLFGAFVPPSLPPFGPAVLAADATPAVIAVFFDAYSFPLLHRGLFLRCNSAGRHPDATAPLLRAYRHPALLAAVSWIGAKCAALRVVSAPAQLSQGTPSAAAKQLQSAAEHLVSTALGSLLSSMRSVPRRGRALMTPDNLATLTAVFLCLRAMWLDRYPGPGYVPMLCSALGVVKEMGIAEELAGSKGDGAAFLLDEEWGNVVWAGAVMDLNSFSGYVKPHMVLPFTLLSQLPFPAPAASFDAALGRAFSDAAALQADVPKESAGSLEPLFSGKPAQMKFFGSGLNAFRFAVCALRARVAALEKDLVGAGVHMSDLVVLDDLDERGWAGAPAPPAGIAGNPALPALRRARRDLLVACASLRASLPSRLRRVDAQGDAASAAWWGRRFFGESRCDDLWSLLLLLNFSELALLGPDSRLPEQRGPWGAQYALSSSLLDAMRLGNTLASYARRSGASAPPSPAREELLASLPPFAFYAWLEAAGYLLACARHLRRSFPATAANTDAAEGAAADARDCLLGCNREGTPRYGAVVAGLAEEGFGRR